MTASKTAQMGGTRPDAVSLSLEDTVVDKKKRIIFYCITERQRHEPCVTLRLFLRACLHLCVKHIASCRPGEVMCGTGQCRPMGSQCASQSSCADSSEEGACGERIVVRHHAGKFLYKC